MHRVDSSSCHDDDYPLEVNEQTRSTFSRTTLIEYLYLIRGRNFITSVCLGQMLQPITTRPRQQAVYFEAYCHAHGFYTESIIGAQAAGATLAE
jgi:hypothetical protein